MVGALAGAFGSLAATGAARRVVLRARDARAVLAALSAAGLRGDFGAVAACRSEDDFGVVARAVDVAFAVFVPLVALAPALAALAGFAVPREVIVFMCSASRARSAADSCGIRLAQAPQNRRANSNCCCQRRAQKLTLWPQNSAG